MAVIGWRITAMGRDLQRTIARQLEHAPYCVVTPLAFDRVFEDVDVQAVVMERHIVTLLSGQERPFPHTDGRTYEEVLTEFAAQIGCVAEFIASENLLRFRCKPAEPCCGIGGRET